MAGGLPRQAVRFGSKGFLWLLGGVFTVGFVLVWVRLLQLQVLSRQELRQRLERQGYVRVTLLPVRGKIVDRRGEVLAQSVEAISYGVDPVMVRCRECLCRAFHEVLGLELGQCEQRLALGRGRFLWLRRGVWGPEARALDTVRDPGLVRLRERVRVYPHGELFRAALGAVGVDQQGLSGLELSFDSLLRVEPVAVLMRRDARGRLLPLVEEAFEGVAQPPILQTTLDGELQRIVAYELAEGVRRAAAESGVAVALEPQTGAIRAFVAVPSPPVGSAHAPLVGQVYEPGSVLKPLIAAAALEQGVVRVTDTVDAHSGQWEVAGLRIVDEHPLRWARLGEALAVSSNIVFAELARRLPPRVLYRYVRDFGFGLPTGIELPGEVAGIVPKPEQFDATTPLFWGFGYGLAATPLQIACAYAAIANDGVLMRPRLVEALRAADGTVRERFLPQRVRQVITAEVARQVRQLLVQVVEEGTGRQARIAGIPLAGKTGTAQQVVEGRYSRQAHTASFVAMVPVERPRLVVLVMLVRPRQGTSGGQVAAPVVRRILQRMAAHPELSTYVRVPGTAAAERSS